MSIAPRSYQPADEIDLLALAERLLLFLRRYKWLLLAAAIIGPVAGYFISARLPKTYKSRLILHSFTLSNLDYIQVIDNWNRLLKKNEVAELSAILGMPDTKLASVKELKGSEIQRVFTPNNPNGFYIDAVVTDNSVLPFLQEGVLHGLENVDYIRKQIAIKKQNFQQLISSVESEISKLEATKALVQQSLSQPSGRGSSLLIDVSGLNKQLLEMNEKLLYYRQELSFASAAQVLQGFSVFSKPAGPNRMLWMLAGMIACLGITFAYTFFHSINQGIKVHRSKKQLVLK